jgi:uncharacterized protein with GYD domain
MINQPSRSSVPRRARCRRHDSDQGVRNVKETISWAEAFKAMAKKSGITVKDLCWTLGQYDVIAVCEGPDDEAATALSLSVLSVVRVFGTASGII